jgi:hypothetical protein
VDSNGTPKLHHIRFLDFFSSDPRVLLFMAPADSQSLMSVFKRSSSSHLLSWIFPSTKTHVTFEGKIQLISSPTLAHRLGSCPRQIYLEGEPSSSSSLSSSSLSNDPTEKWEAVRASYWNALSSQLRADFGSGGCGSIESLVDAYGKPTGKAVSSEIAANHTRAFDNFVVIVMRVGSVEMGKSGGISVVF